MDVASSSKSVSFMDVDKTAPVAKAPPEMKAIAPEKSKFSKSSKKQQQQYRSLRVPSNRYTPLKKNWMKICSPIVEHLKLEVRFNTESHCVEIRTCKATGDINAIQKVSCPISPINWLNIFCRFCSSSWKHASTEIFQDSGRSS